jgi:hypothetical protein
METLWEKMKFWKKKLMNPEDYIEGKHFTFVDSDDKQFTGIALLIEGYEGVLYHYYQARVVEDSGIGKLQFSYNIVQSGKHDVDVLNNDEKFSKIMGDILTKILMDQEKYGTLGKSNTEESDLQ